MESYGYNFSKEDHLELIRLFLDVILLPDLDLGSVKRLVAPLCLLLKLVENELAEK